MQGWELRWSLPNNSRRMRTDGWVLETAMSHFEIDGDKRISEHLSNFPPEIDQG
jgi:hypothetical protein